MMFSATTIKHSLYKCSPALARVINASEVTRPDALKKIWAYIK
jgi:chromatin remodeling complex protein RSC6